MDAENSMVVGAQDEYERMIGDEPPDAEELFQWDEDGAMDEVREACDDIL